MIQSLACALIATGGLDPSDTAAAYRNSAEAASNEIVASELLAFAASWEEAGARAERLLAPGWTPAVVAGGKDDGDGDT